ncbi:MAG: acido-empty-quinoprotein group A [Bryobacteraceae bacterium]
MNRLLLFLVPAAASILSAQADLAKPPTTSWPTYNGDYSGRRYSPLTGINTGNVHQLSLGWVHRTQTGGGGFGTRVSATPVQLNGVLYFAVPDHVWAVDARTGRQIWHFAWESKGGIHIGNRGVGISGNFLYFETPDCHLVSLNIKDGKERWRQSICDLDQFYFATMAPLIIGNHVITGVSGDDLDRPGYIESHDPETGALQWRTYTVPMKQGDPGLSSWPSLEMAQHGGGMTWITPTYDPELNLIFFGTGNPQPVIAAKGRPGDNLYAESIVAVNPDTGRFAWGYSVSPHDTHDWDGVETPVLIDGEINGRKRKLVAQASRNGYFFVLDRATGKNVVTSEFVKPNWAKDVDAEGHPRSNPAKEPQVDGALVSPNQGGGTNWYPPAFNPDTGLFYVNASHAYSIYYIYDDSEKPEGWGGNDRGGYQHALLQAIDYKTGKIKWSRKFESGGTRGGLLTTAGRLVFGGDPAGNFVAFDAASGDPLWHANLGNNVTNGPITYEMDGRQWVVVAAGDTLYGFVMNSK